MGTEIQFCSHIQHFRAYEIPSQNLLSKIEESEYRSKLFFEKEDKTVQKLITEAKTLMQKKGGLCDTNAAQEGVKKAKDRMRSRYKAALAAKVSFLYVKISLLDRKWNCNILLKGREIPLTPSD